MAKYFTTNYMLDNTIHLRRAYHSAIRTNRERVDGYLNQEADRYFPAIRPRTEAHAKEIEAEIKAEYKELYAIVAQKEIALKELYQYVSKIAQFTDINIHIRGDWIWVNGDTKPIADKLADAGFFYCKIKQCYAMTTDKLYVYNPENNTSLEAILETEFEDTDEDM